MKEFRCKDCGSLIGMIEDDIIAKCPKCKSLNCSRESVTIEPKKEIKSEEPNEPQRDTRQLFELNTKELREIAKGYGLAFKGGTTKEAIIDAIKEKRRGI